MHVLALIRTLYNRRVIINYYIWVKYFQAIKKAPEGAEKP
jgi:hypothetical protein